MSNRTDTVDLSQEELDAILTSDKVLDGLIKDLNRPVEPEIKAAVKEALAGYPPVIYGPGGCYIQY